MEKVLIKVVPTLFETVRESLNTCDSLKVLLNEVAVSLSQGALVGIPRRLRARKGENAAATPVQVLRYPGCKPQG